MRGHPRFFVANLLAASVLAACGGGGSDSPTAMAPAATPSAAPAPAGGPGSSPAPAPGPAPAPAPTAAVVQVAADTQLVSNTSYEVSAAGTSALALRLPAAPAPGDTVTVRGVGTAPWTLSQNAGQAILTAGLPGGLAPGAQWTPHLGPRIWHWLSTSATGEVLLAGEAAGGLQNTSTDAGANWTAGNSMSGIWISSAASADGRKLVALQYGGGMFISTDFGATWSRVTDPLVNAPGGLAFESVAMSQDGQRILASVQPDASVPAGRLVQSSDGGATWRLAAIPPGTYWWRGVAVSADGSVMVTVANSGEVLVSRDAGASWNAVTVALGNSPVVENWYRVALSGNAATLVVVANSYGGAPGSGVFVSHDLGTTWSRPFTLTADYSEASVSADGRTVAVSVSNTGGTPGRVLLSTDSGASFNALAMPGTDTDWRAVSLSGDGDQLAAATGRFNTGTAGQLYTSLGNRSSIGAGGGITGGQNNGVVLAYQGGGRWAVQSASGSAFAVR